MAKVQIQLDFKTGKLNIDGIGFSGNSCDSVINELANSIGKVESSEEKPEYYEQVNRNEAEN